MINQDCKILEPCEYVEEVRPLRKIAKESCGIKKPSQNLHQLCRQMRIAKAHVNDSCTISADCMGKGLYKLAKLRAQRPSKHDEHMWSKESAPTTFRAKQLRAERISRVAVVFAHADSNRTTFLTKRDQVTAKRRSINHMQAGILFTDILL